MRKPGLLQVDCEAIGGVQWIDLDKIHPSVGLEALEIHRKHTDYPKITKFPMRKAGAAAVLFVRACEKVLSQKSKAKLFEGSNG